MTVVYVRETGAVVRKTGQQIRVTEGERDLYDIPLANLEQVILMGPVQITTPAAVMLMGAGIDVVFMSKYGRYRGRLMTNESRFADLRHQQLRLCDDSVKSLHIAKQIVRGKINNQRVILQRRAQEDPRTLSAVDGMLAMLNAVEQATDLDQLRGYEGKAAALYFSAVRSFFTPEWGFNGRAYHPPPDPANALLSFTYTQLMRDVEAKIQLVGLDPYLGFFHALGYNRPGLALDIMEEFRPSIADSVVLNLVRGGQMNVADFEQTGQPDFPYRLGGRGIALLVQAYEKRMQEKVSHPLANGQTDYRRAVELQVRQMARVVRGEANRYDPLVMS